MGRQIALHFAAHNAGGVAINDYFAERAQAVAAEVEAAGVPALAVACDVSDAAAVAATVRSVEERFGRVDILVNNAGNGGVNIDLGNLRPFWETDPSEWKQWVDVNFYGVLNCARAVVPGMLDRKCGRIITLISDAGRVGEPHFAVYSGAKAGAAGFMRAWPRRSGAPTSPRIASRSGRPRRRASPT